MKIDWLKIADNVFEEIVAQLLRVESCHNVNLRRGGSDGGWDIDADWPAVLPNNQFALQPCRVECKRYGKSPPPEKIFHHYDRMKTGAPGFPLHLLFVCATNFSNPLKTDLQQRAKEDRIILHIWEGEDLARLLLKHSANSELWHFLCNSPESLVHPDFDFETFRTICASQVIREITTKVGRKYIPELYFPRPLEQEIDLFLTADLDRQQLSELSEEMEMIHAKELQGQSKTQFLAEIAKFKSAPTFGACKSTVATARGIISEKNRIKFDESVATISACRRNVLLIKDKAGSGKTNLLAHIAKRLCDTKGGKTAALFITCKFGVTSDDSVDHQILSSLREAMLANVDGMQPTSPLPPAELEMLYLLGSVLRASGSELIIFIDGVNENKDIPLLDVALQHLFAGWNSFPIKFVVTCRDIFWTFFSEALWRPFLFRKRLFDLPAFDYPAVERIAAAYFKVFEIQGELSGEAKDRCRHPLLLRFFCEAYSGRQIGKIDDVRLHDLFEAYWTRKRSQIADALRALGAGDARVEQFIMQMARAMMDDKTNSLHLFSIGRVTGEGDLDSNNSIYKRLLDEDIILEELPAASSMDRSYLARRVSFVYDEFYDFVLAISFVREKSWDTKDIRDVLLEFLDLVKQSDSFPQLRGVAVYLVLFSERRNLHIDLCRVLSFCGRHEILLNVVPKLVGAADWASTILLSCMKSIETFSKKGLIHEVRHSQLYEQTRTLLREHNFDGSTTFGPLAR